MNYTAANTYLTNLENNQSEGDIRWYKAGTKKAIFVKSFFGLLNLIFWAEIFRICSFRDFTYNDQSISIQSNPTNTLPMLYLLFLPFLLFVVIVSYNDQSIPIQSNPTNTLPMLYLLFLPFLLFVVIVGN